MTRTLADRYELGEVIGAGGMAKVHLADDTVLDRKVAVKVLDDVAARSADPAARDRFLNEARSAAAFSHPNAVAVFDAGEDDGVLFIVLELVQGESLAARMAREAPLPVADSVDIAAHVLDALDSMHAAGVLHRDVKPANVLLDRHGQVKLTDFGIAKRLDEIDEALTSAGTVIGTPHYLAPEQAVGASLGPPTDVYLVGAVLYEMLTGRRPPSVLAGGSVRPPSPGAVRPGVPDDLDRIVVRSLAHRAEDRFASAAEMATALRAVTIGPNTRAAPTPPTTVMPAAAVVGTTSELPLADTTSPTGEIPVESATVETTEAGFGEAGFGEAGFGEPVLAERPDTQGPRRRRGPWLVASLVAATVALLLGLAIRAAESGGSDGPAAATLPPPANGEEFLAALRADPGRFGSKGDDLLGELDSVLAEADPARRAEAVEQLEVDIFVWVAEGDLDTSVGGLVSDLLARRAP